MNVHKQNCLLALSLVYTAVSQKEDEPVPTLVSLTRRQGQCGLNAISDAEASRSRLEQSNKGIL